MRQWAAVFKRENLELWRNFKWIWVPIVFVLLGVMDPISTYYLPKILDAVGGMPDGATINLPEFLAEDILMASLSQFSQLGVLIIVLMTMGMIARERRSGVAELILVKPVKYSTYITAKWAATVLLVWVSLACGVLMSWYYTSVLFGELSFSQFMHTLLFYSLWLILVVSISVFMNTLVKNSGVVAFLTFITIIASSILTNIFNKYLVWSPNRLSEYIMDTLNTGVIPTELWGTAGVTLVLVIMLLVASIFTLKNKELA
ncbi:ABC transporter permease [Pseudalkalibacillus sp. Hm43]|uniref:ABC transporter permease n=1 Tax=Pseudalkalibacillus sp. Hm43 TaxID=3450742 RepID=UPI003F438C47